MIIQSNTLNKKMEPKQIKTDKSTIYWKENNKGLLNDLKNELEQKLNKINNLIEQNEKAESFDQTSSIYWKIIDMQ